MPSALCRNGLKCRTLVHDEKVEYISKLFVKILVFSNPFRVYFSTTKIGQVNLKYFLVKVQGFFICLVY